MTERQGWRLVLEALFLVVLAVALALAKLRALEIAGIMVLGWLLVALLEWAAWRGEPHYGSGLPPRYYVPTINLPPAQPLEQVQVGYPRGNRDEEATWIAPAALRAEVLGEWPHAAPAPLEAEPEVEAEQPLDVVPVELPAELPADFWTAAPPLPELVAQPEPEPDPEPEPVAVTEPEPVAVTDPEPVPEPDVAAEQAPEPAPAPPKAAVARYSFDPLPDPAGAGRRRFGRGLKAASIEVPARPAGPRPLPGRSS